MPKVWTIGYEHTSMPAFLAALQEAGVEVVADVRAIAASRRPGFSKNALAANLHEAGIEYRQFRALGTPPDGRTAARGHDLPKLKRIYAGQLELPEAIAAGAELSDLVHHRRVAFSATNASQLSATARCSARRCCRTANRWTCLRELPVVPGLIGAAGGMKPWPHLHGSVSSLRGDDECGEAWSGQGSKVDLLSVYVNGKQMSLPQVLAAARPIDGGFAATVPAHWMQGRTAYGGFSAALALVAAQRLADDLPPLRSATVNFVGPISGDVEVRAKLLRRGRNASWISAEVVNEAGVGLTATFVFMGPVEASSLHLHHVPVPAHAVPLDQAVPLPAGAGPAFAPNFERRFAQPRSEVKVPEILWWERLKDTDGLDPMVAMMLLADALPPAVMPLTGSVPISSMTWLLNLLTPLPETDDGWFLLQALANYAEKGCSSQDMAIWNTRGEAVAVGMQSVAVFG